MRQLTCFVASAVVTVVAATSVAMIGPGSGTAAADGTSATSGSASIVPLTTRVRRCDWSSAQYVPGASVGTGEAIISKTGGTVTAEVQMVTVTPDIWYGVRVVQVPRPGISCGAGEPGVGFAQLFTDWTGTGSVTVQTPIMDGATGVWVSVEGPLGEASQLTADVRTSDYIVPI